MGEISVKITQWCSRSISVYGLFIWVQSFHLGMVFSFGHGLFIWAWSFHLGTVFSFGYGLVFGTVMGMVFSFFHLYFSFGLAMGMVFSFWHGLFIWVLSFHLGMVSVGYGVCVQKTRKIFSYSLGFVYH